MPAVILQTERDELLGFLLLAGSESIEAGPDRREFVFTGVPKESSLMTHPLSDFIQTHKNIEYLVSVKVSSPNLHLLALIDEHNSFELVLPIDGTGKWSVTINGTAHTGRCAEIRDGTN